MKPPAVKRLLLPAILLAGLTLFFASGANEIISWGFLGTHYAAIKSFAGDHIWLGYLAFFCSYVLAVAFSLPIASLLTLAGGSVLGWPAVILVVTAATTGAGLVFLAARNLFTDLLRQRAGAFFTKLEKGFSENAFFYLLALRLVPAAPFWAVNIVPALTRMPFRQEPKSAHTLFHTKGLTQKQEEPKVKILTVKGVEPKSTSKNADKLCFSLGLPLTHHLQSFKAP